MNGDILIKDNVNVAMDTTGNLKAEKHYGIKMPAFIFDLLSYSTHETDNNSYYSIHFFNDRPCSGTIEGLYCNGK